jgi:hypothetical protein
MNGRTLRLISAAALCVALIAAATAQTGGAAPGHEAASAAKKKCKKNRSAVASRKKCKKSVPPPAPTPTPTPTPAPNSPPPPTPASLSISPTSFNYGTVLGDSGDQTFTVTNSGQSPSGTLATSIGGTDPTHFVINSDTCNGAALGGGSSCTVLVHCSNPDANGVPRSATLTVAGSPGGSPVATLSCVEIT